MKTEFLILETEAEYRIEYLKTYTEKSKKYFINGIPIIFDENDFNHIFSEPNTFGVRTFSKRRAKRMLFIKTLLETPKISEILYEPGYGNLAVFSKDLEIVLYARPRKGSGILQVATFFDFGKDHTKMYEKQFKKCMPITEDIIKNLFK